MLLIHHLLRNLQREYNFRNFVMSSLGIRLLITHEFSCEESKDLPTHLQLNRMNALKQIDSLDKGTQGSPSKGEQVEEKQKRTNRIIQDLMRRPYAIFEVSNVHSNKCLT